MRRDDFELPRAAGNDRPSDQYRCGKACQGDRMATQICALGPTSEGICRHDNQPCTPVPTATLWRRRQKLATIAMGLLIFVLACYYGGREFYKPGALSTPHAQILAARLAGDACAACHPQAGSSPLQWILSGHPSATSLQSDRCMDCHHTRLPREYARMAHNLSPAQLQQLSQDAQRVTPVNLHPNLPRPSFELDDVSCAACHREHAGADADLTALSDAQCQTCHSNRYANFASDHPPWGSWPYVRIEALAFDHQSHAQRHFPTKPDAAGLVTSFDCVRCHEATDSGNFARISSYADACGSCHDQSLQQQTSEPLDLFVVPGLLDPDPSVVAAWPAAATGYFDGRLGPLTRLLLAGNRESQSAVSTLPGEGDFTRIQATDRAQRQAAETIAVAVRDWIGAMATQGPIPSSSHLHDQHPGLRAVLRSLPAQLVNDAYQRWFLGAPSSLADKLTPRGRESVSDRASYRVRPAALRTENAEEQLLGDANDDLLLDETSNQDPLLGAMDQDPLDDQATRVKDRSQLRDDHPTTLQPDGGWYVDDRRMAISYRGHGHADPVLRAAIELVVGLPSESAIRSDLLASPPAAACIRCHPGANTTGIITWRPLTTNANVESQFTKFSHKPHMNLPIMSDCKHCHAIAGDVNQQHQASLTSVSIVQGSPIPTSHDFLPIALQTCAGCHTQGAAGDACVQCHRYHRESVLAPLRPVDPATR